MSALPTTRRAVLLGALAVAACGRSEPASATVTVLAAASLTDALSELARAYEAAHPGLRIRLSFAASGAVANQVLRGAPADVVVLADEPWMDRLTAARAVDPGSRSDLLTNTLVVIAPANAPQGGPFSWAEALGPIAIGDPASVPAGAYARSLLQGLGVWEAVRPCLVFGGDVRAVRTFVARSEARYGVVYRSDALGDATVRVVAVPEPARQPRIVYPAAAGARANPQGRAFLDWLSGPAADGVFTRRGFGRPRRGS